jgi:hypothetical protein
MQVNEITVDFGPIGVGQRRFAELQIVNESPFAAECLLSSAGKISKSGAVSVCRPTALYPLFKYPLRRTRIATYIAAPDARVACQLPMTSDEISNSSTQCRSLLYVLRTPVWTSSGGDPPRRTDRGRCL